MSAVRVVSLFSGGGFSDVALYRAAEALGVEVKVVDAIDSWPTAVRVYNANLPHPVARVADVKQMTATDLPPHDLIIGGPPCQPHSLAGKRLGSADPRDCIPDFFRLADDSAWLMENVRSRLATGWSEQFCAADFGDVTSRKRWFYSSHLLHVVKTPGPRRIRDIRDHAEDERVLRKRAGCKAGMHGHYGSFDSLDSLTAHSWHGHDVRGYGRLLLVTHRPRTNSQGCEPYPTVGEEDGFFASMTADVPRAYSGETLKIGLRGHSASASAFEDDGVLGSLLSNAHHANEASRLVGCRNPSLLEMARAHSIPDSWDWAGANKSERGKLIANGWPVGMGTAVARAMLEAIVALKASAA